MAHLGTLGAPAPFVPTRMTVLDNGFISRKLPTSSTYLPDDIRPEAYCGYQNLATSHDTHVSGYALDICLEYEFGFLDEKAKGLINLETTCLEELWLCTKKTKQQKARSFKDFVATATRYSKEHPEIFNKIKSAPYTIIPANTGNHWITLLVELERERGLASKGYTQVKRMAVIDPTRRAEITVGMERRVQTLLKIGGFTVPENCLQDIKTRYQRDHHSCGPRAYQIIKTLLHRINHTVSKKTMSLDTVWTHMTEKPFIAEKVRAKMRGICAEVLIQDCSGLIRAVFVQTKGVVPCDTGIPVGAASILYPSRPTRTVSTLRASSTTGKRKRCSNDAENEECELSELLRPVKQARARK